MPNNSDECSYTNFSKFFISLSKEGTVLCDGPSGPISSDYLAYCSHPVFMSIRKEFSASYSMLSQSLVTPNSLARFFINLSSVSVLWGAHANYSYCDTCSKLRTSAASACNWPSYCTFNVMVERIIIHALH